MSIDTWHKDWVESEPDKVRLEEKVEILEKFFDRVKDVVLAYEDEEKYKDVIEDIKWEIENVEVAL